MLLLFGVAAVITGFLAVCLLFFQATRKTYPGFGYWTAGVGFLALGYLLYALRGQIPLWSSVFLGTVAFPLGLVLHLDGIRRFLGLKPASGLWYAVPAGVLAALAFFYFQWDSFVWRSLVASIPITAIHWTMAALLFRSAVSPHSTFDKIIGSLLGLGGLLILARAVWLVSAPNSDLLWKAPLEFAFFTSFIVIHLGENLSLIMLNAERVESELVVAKDDLSQTVRSLQEALVQQKQTEESLRDSEEKYRSFFVTSRDCVFMTAEDGRFIDFNDVALETLGYAHSQREEVLGKNVSYLYANPEEREAHATIVAEIGFSKEYPVDLRKQDGTIIHTLITTVARKGPHGKISGFQGTVHDITNLKKAQEERENLRSQLLQAQKMEAIGTLTGGIAHDFNNLLTIINGYTEMILMGKSEDDPIYADLQKILQTGQKGADMVQRLLSYTKRAVTKPEPMDLNQRIEENKNLMERTFPKMIEIETNLWDDLEIVNADAGQMDQLLMNLCINAKDAMPDGGRLRIETRNITVDDDYCRLHVGATPGRYVLVEVSDTGAGMSRETMDRVFDPFFTTKGWDFKKGTGLGLSVAKGIVEQHGGWIVCESKQGIGTTFRVYFPAIEESPEVRKPEPSAETVPGGEKILLVDDEEYVRDLGQRILERSGYTVITAANGKEALEIYAREQSNIALVVLDLVMPQMGGEKCLEGLLKINAKVKVIVSSGQPLDARERLFLGALIRGVVNKPYEMRQMVETVNVVLDVGRHE